MQHFNVLEITTLKEALSAGPNKVLFVLFYNISVSDNRISIKVKRAKHPKPVILLDYQQLCYCEHKKSI